MSDPLIPASAEEAINYYRNNRLKDTERNAGRTDWEPYLKEMIVEKLSLTEILIWISLHHKSLGFKKPADTTVRDWVSQIRDEIGLRLRRKKSNQRTDAGKPRSAPATQSSSPKSPTLLLPEPKIKKTYPETESSMAEVPVPAPSPQKKTETPATPKTKIKTVKSFDSVSPTPDGKRIRLNEISAEIDAVPFEDANLWAEQVIKLQSEEYGLINDREATAVDIADLRRGLPNFLLDQKKKARKALPK